MISLGQLSRALGADMVWPRSPGHRQDPSQADSTPVRDVEHDSRLVGPGALFACIPGELHDGHRFAGDAVSAGAIGLLAERPLLAGVPCLVVESVRAAVGPAAAAVHGNPSQRLDVAGVTGTNGKTTTVRLLAGLLRDDGTGTAEIGTLTGTLTTPEATDLQRELALALGQGAGAAAVEVTSHGLVQHRLDGCRFRVAAFTNLGHDHLDYHGSMEDYFAAKTRLFKRELADRAVVDTTTEWGRRLAKVAATEIPVTEVDQRRIEVMEADARSSTFCWRGRKVRLPLAGAFNRANAVLAAEVAAALGMDPAAAVAGLAAAEPVPGRFESVQAGQDYAVIVDYAHTPDGLAAALRAARSLTDGDLTVVFGAGGDRDRAKRPEMGAAAARLADRVIVTSDNPRSEDPDQIISEIVEGMDRVPDRCDADRRLALRHALSVALPGDTVLVAGKGHETSQTIGSERLPFDDRTVIREEIERLAACDGMGNER